MVAQGGFQAPTDAVASPDGSTFYFAAFTDAAESDPAIFRIASAGGAAAEIVAQGDPLGLPIGLVMACDGATVYVADGGSATTNADGDRLDAGPVLAVSTAGGAAIDLAVTGLTRPAGIAMGPDCDRLYLTGRTAEGAPALFSAPLAGGAASIVYQGAPLVSPTGLHVDTDGVAWVMDHNAFGPIGEGVLFAIPSDGASATVVVDDLRMGTPGGVSLTAGGGTAVMPTQNEDGASQLTAVEIESGTITQIPATSIVAPAGLRTAREAGVFAVVDSDGSAIYSAR
jgi:sugar lactone lactonase YvrE